MLKLWLLKTRPVTIFDVENKEHRKEYYKFKITKSWKHSKYQFVPEEPYLDIISTIENKLIDYYVDREFDEKKTARKKRSNS